MYEKHAQELLAIQTMRPRLLRQRRDDLVILCLRHTSLCAEAHLTLKPEHFNLLDEKPHKTIIRHLWKLIEKDGYSPGKVPYAAIYNEVATDFLGLRPEELDQAWVGETINDPTEPGWEDVEPGLIYRAYHYDLAAYDDKYAFGTLKLFLEERAVVDAVASLVASTAGARVPLDHTAQVSGILETARRIEAIGSNPFSLPMPADWLPVPLQPFPTGAAWVDDKLNGQVAGDVNGVIGPFGGGKTTGLTQIATGSGEYFLKEAEKTGTKPKIALMVSYEEREELIRPRVLSCAAQVSKTKLEQMKSLDELTRRGQLSEYEITMYREAGQEDFSNLDGEYERLQQAAVRINQSVRIVDMRSGGRGYGWVDELAGFIERFRDENECEIGVVCIDYVNAMVRRYVDTLPRVDSSTLRDKIQRTPLQVEEKIAHRFNCPVWLAQQFSGEANKKTPTATMMLADASEARSFGENLVFCVGFGNADPKTGVIQTTFLKSRRKGVQGATGLVRLDGDLARLRPADQLYIVHNGKILDRRVVKQFDGDIAIAGAKSPLLITGGAVSSWGTD